MNKKLIDLAFYIYLKGVVGVTAPVFYRIDCFSCNSKQLSHLLKHPLAKHKLMVVYLDTFSYSPEKSVTLRSTSVCEQ